MTSKSSKVKTLPNDSPKRRQLKQLLSEALQVQDKINATIKRGERSSDPQVIEGCRHRARQLVQEFASLTWNVIAGELELAGILPTAQWTRPSYYRADELRQWAKVRALPTGRFIFEAVSHDGQGVLAEVATFQFLAQWQPCTELEYNAVIGNMLSSGSIQWNQPQLPKAELL